MTDSATGWIKICSVLDPFANQVEQLWLTRYPLPNQIIVDLGKEVLV